jgi:hypothetical protein
LGRDAPLLKNDIAALKAETTTLGRDATLLKKEVSALKAEASTMGRDALALKKDLSALRDDVPVRPGRRLDSRILTDIPDIFEEFRGKQLTVLWRGSRDGFRARDFHRCCDGHANTLTVIFDRDGNIFGGFTPVEWSSKKENKRDPSKKSFIFTLKNPANVPPRTFAPNDSGWAISCNPAHGPDFFDIGVFDNCNAESSNETGEFGFAYNNDTGLDKRTFFTGAPTFMVKEIEVFEITG